MDHDVRSLHTYVETRFNALEGTAARMHAENTIVLADIKLLQKETNGRLRKVEIVVAVMKFGFVTIGGTFAYLGLQLLIQKLGLVLP